MRFKEIRLQNYRNISFAGINVDAPCVFFLGKNGQGKTNLLEALGMLTALRSFRASERKNLIMHGESESQLYYTVEDDRDGEAQVHVKMGVKSVNVEVGGEKVARLSDILGHFPTVVLASDDMQLLRGRPSLRRRFLDMTLCSIDPEYFEAVRYYQKALMERNAAFKNPGSALFLDPYDKILAQRGLVILRKRRECLEHLNDLLGQYYEKISGFDEAPELAYRPDFSFGEPQAYLFQLKKDLARDRILKITGRGVHRDDCVFKLKGKVARDFASEGQQRSLVLALRLAQMAYFKEKSGKQCVVLADDILGELDPERSKRFWDAIGNEVQVIATGTELPETATHRAWQVYVVEEGQFRFTDQALENLTHKH